MANYMVEGEPEKFKTSNFGTKNYIEVPIEKVYNIDIFDTDEVYTARTGKKLKDRHFVIVLLVLNKEGDTEILGYSVRIHEDAEGNKELIIVTNKSIRELVTSEKIEPVWTELDMYCSVNFHRLNSNKEKIPLPVIIYGISMFKEVLVGSINMKTLTYQLHKNYQHD
jgi:hypothetical protein